MSSFSSAPASASRRRRLVLGGLAAAVAGGLALTGPVAGVFAASAGQPRVQTSETVQAQLDASGKVDVARVFSQLQATGSGTVSVLDPTSSKGLRNLDGWSGPSVTDGKARYDFSVDGTRSFRTVATYDKDLPVTVDVTYALDGRKIDPADLAGRSGKLAVTYDIKNTTAEPTQITYQDGHGKQVSETVDVVTPFVGQLALDLPGSFRNIVSTGNRADQAGNGHGGRLVTWTMVLFEPIGQVEQRFGFTADVAGAALPPAKVQIVPVSPENHPELKFGQDGFQSGARTGRDLTDGTTQIDANLLKLRDGASQLLDGLTQLQVGATQLNDGLASGVPAAIDGGRQLAKGAGDAAAGGTKLAAGATKVAAGNKDLASGLGALAAGAGQLQVGAGSLLGGATQLSLGFQDPTSDSDLIDGSQALAGALGLISGGLAQLNDASSGLPAAKAGLIALKAAVDTQVIPAIGTTSGPCDPVDPTKQTLLGCMQQIVGGVTQLGTSHSTTPSLAGLPTIRDGVTAASKGLNGDPSSADPQVQLGIKGGVAAVQSGLGAALTGGGDIDTLAAAIKGSGDCGPTCQFYVDQLLNSATNPSPPFPPGSRSLRQKVSDANNGLLAVLAAIGSASSTSPSTLNGGLNLIGGGLDSAVAQVTGQLLPGVTGVRAGLARLRAGLTNADANGGSGNPRCNPSAASGAVGYCGLSEAIAQLVSGVTSAVGGVGQLAPGAVAASNGAGDLALGVARAGDGAAQLAAGAKQLSDGLDQVGAKVPAAVAGAQALAKGSAALAEGSVTLSRGLSGQLAPGANKLSDGLAGLQAAVDGSGQIADGLTQAKAGNEAIVSGAGRLRSEGTSKLVQAGEEAAVSYGREYATMQALNRKGADNALPYGAPKGATDNRGAYDLTIAGVGHEGGLGNAGRGVTGLLVLGLGALAATLVRGRFA